MNKIFDFGVLILIIGLLFLQFATASINADIIQFNDDTDDNADMAYDTIMPEIVPAQFTCSDLEKNDWSSVYFDMCEENGFETVCFNQYSGEYQGCGLYSFNDCTVYNTYASQNIRCGVQILVEETAPDEPIIGVAGLPDLAIVEVKFDKDEYTVGDYVNTQVKIKNYGYSDSGPFDLGLTYNVVYNSGSVGQGYTSLPAGESVWINMGGVQYTEAGSHTVIIEVDPFNNIQELSENNNYYSTSIFIAPDYSNEQGLSNLIVQGVRIIPENPSIGDRVQLYATIQNIGDAPAVIETSPGVAPAISVMWESVNDYEDYWGNGQAIGNIRPISCGQSFGNYKSVYHVGESYEEEICGSFIFKATTNDKDEMTVSVNLLSNAKVEESNYEDNTLVCTTGEICLNPYYETKTMPIEHVDQVGGSSGGGMPATSSGTGGGGGTSGPAVTETEFVGMEAPEPEIVHEVIRAKPVYTEYVEEKSIVTVDMSLLKGWNLISVPTSLEKFIKNAQATKKMLGYVNVNGEYMSITDAYAELGDSLKYLLLEQSWWIYSYDNQDLSLEVDLNTGSTMTELKMDTGWNLLPVTFGMIGKSLASMKNTCNFEGIFDWNEEKQGWVEVPLNFVYKRSDIGGGYGVKVTDVCTIWVQEDKLKVPAFPTIRSGKEKRVYYTDEKAVEEEAYLKPTKTMPETLDDNDFEHTVMNDELEEAPEQEAMIVGEASVVYGIEVADIWYEVVGGEPRIYAKIVDMNNNGAFMKMSEDRGVQFMIYYTDGNGGIAEDEYSFDYDRNYYYAPIPANSLDPGYYTATVMVGESGSVIASASKTINVWE